MKKTIIILILIVSLISINGVCADKPLLLTIGTGGTGGTYYPVGATMTTIFNKYVEGVHVGVQSTAGTCANLNLMKTGEVQIATVDTAAIDAYYGRKAYKDNQMPWIRVLTPLYPENIHVFVTKKSGIDSVYELKGKKISVGSVASGTEQYSKHFLAGLGLTFEDIDARNLSNADTTIAIKDRIIDGAIMGGSLGMAAITETASLGLIKFLPVPDKLIQKMKEENSYYMRLDIPANAYRGQTETIKGIGCWNMIIIHKNIPEDIVYNMVKALFEHKEDLIATSIRMRNMSLDNLKNIVLPFHPGAKRYYADKGYDVK